MVNQSSRKFKQNQIIFCIQPWCIAVSYTHLDVYKRQPLYRSTSPHEENGWLPVAGAAGSSVSTRKPFATHITRQLTDAVSHTPNVEEEHRADHLLFLQLIRPARSTRSLDSPHFRSRHLTAALHKDVESLSLCGCVRSLFLPYSSEMCIRDS